MLRRHGTRREAQLIAVKLTSFDGEALKLKGTDRTDYIRSMQTIRSLAASSRFGRREICIPGSTRSEETPPFANGQLIYGKQVVMLMML